MSEMEFPYDGYLIKVSFPNITTSQRRNFNKAIQKLIKRTKTLERISQGVWLQKMPVMEGKIAFEKETPIFTLIAWAKKYGAQFRCFFVKESNEVIEDYEIVKRLLEKMKRRKYYKP